MNHRIVWQRGAELLPLVDVQGNVIGIAPRAYCHGGSHALHPVVHLHVFNSRGELYLQHRPAWKDIQPNRWDTAVGGHVDFGEDIYTALRREVLEEIGIVLPEVPSSAVSLVGKYVFRSPVEAELVHSFRITTDVQPTPTEELDGGRFFSLEEISSHLDTGFFTPNFEQEYRRFFL